MAANYRIEQRCCATCRWWNGARMVDFAGGNRPIYVKVGDMMAKCDVKNGSAASAGSSCPKWIRWEKI